MSTQDNKESKSISPPVAAIGYSSNNCEGSPIASQPRPPRNLQDLLRYSTEAANALGETTSDNSVKPLDEESKKFLEEALKSMTVDVVEELLKSIRILQNANAIPENGDTTKCEEALDNIFDFVDNLDVANDFQKIGGFCIFKPCLESIHDSIRWRGAELIAELCQNNPYCQSKVLETGLMPGLLKMVDSDVDDTVRVKALYAISCLVRENDEGFQEFVSSDGFSVLLRALQMDLEKLNIKSAFLLTSICQKRPQVKDDIVGMGYIEQLIGQLAIHIQKCDEGHPPSLEHLISALIAITEDHEQAKEIARRPELQLKNLLDYVVKNSEENDQYNEENEYGKNLIRIVFGESEGSEEER